MGDNRSLATKYRPEYFEDIVGQEEVKSILAKQKAKDDLRSAYLFLEAQEPVKLLQQDVWLEV